MAKKPAREENDFKPLLMTLGLEPAQEELCPLGKASAAGKKSKKMPGKRTPFGDDSAGSPGVGDGSWTGLGSGWEEEFTQLQLSH